MRSLVKRYGPVALITGAAHGIGAEFARQCARHGFRLVLVDADAEGLAELTADLPAEADTIELTADLSTPTGVQATLNAAAAYDVGLLVCNAGVGPVGAFLDQPLASHLRMIDLNASAALALTHEIGGAMARRQRGGVILLSSMSALRGAPYTACYAATKAFNLTLATSLWGELQARGVDVLALTPGLTRTPGLLANHPDPRRLHAMSVEPVVRAALATLGRAPVCVPGRRNRLASAALALLPRSLAVRLVGRQMRALFGG